MEIKLKEIYRVNPHLLPALSCGFWDSERKLFCQCNEKEKEAVKLHLIDEALNILGPRYGIGKRQEENYYKMVLCSDQQGTEWTEALCEAVNICLDKSRDFINKNIESHKTEKTWNINYYRFLDDCIFDELDDSVYIENIEIQKQFSDILNELNNKIDLKMQEIENKNKNNSDTKEIEKEQSQVLAKLDKIREIIKTL